jgi:hypothetical protein
MEDRKAELLPIDYFHLVFKVPAELAEIAYQNKALVLDVIMTAAAETLKAVAADPKYLGAEIGFVLQLHTSSESILFHPHVHCLVSGGGLSPDGSRWVSREDFLPRHVLTDLFRHLCLAKLKSAFADLKLEFYGDLQSLNELLAFARHLANAKAKDWRVHIEPPISGPEQVLDYMSRHTQSLAIANQRLINIDGGQITFKLREAKTMTLAADEFIRRVLMHILPRGFHTVRSYGFLVNRYREKKIALCRALLGAPIPQQTTPTGCQGYKDRYEELTGHSLSACPQCTGGQMMICAILAEPIVPPHARVNSS